MAFAVKRRDNNTHESFVLKENERRIAKVENSRNIKRQTSNLGLRFAVCRIIRKTRC